MSGPARIAFLDSWLRSPQEGSGTAVAISGLAHGLAALGHRVEPVGPERPGPPFGIDLDAWDRVRTFHGRKASGDGADPVLLHVARQYRRKDTRTLLEALPRVTLRVVGGGPEIPALKRRARGLGLDDRVTFLGEVPDDDAVRGEYLTADVFCLPSRQEGFGIGLLEATAAGERLRLARGGPAVPRRPRAGLTGGQTPMRSRSARSTSSSSGKRPC